MTKTRTIKVISVLLCAVMVVSCCFVGCRGVLTREKLVESIKTDFPEAHISEKDRDIYFFEDESMSEYLDLNPQENLRDFHFDICNLSSLDNTKKILNSIMPHFANGWDSTDSEKFIASAQPNADFTEWDNWSLAGALRVKGVELVPLSADDNGYLWIAVGFR